VETVLIIMLVLALACFIAAAVGASARINLVALGLAFWVLTLLIPRL
jgi:hypothetical protein